MTEFGGSFVQDDSVEADAAGDEIELKDAQPRRQGAGIMEA